MKTLLVVAVLGASFSVMSMERRSGDLESATLVPNFAELPNRFVELIETVKKQNENLERLTNVVMEMANRINELEFWFGKLEKAYKNRRSNPIATVTRRVVIKKERAANQPQQDN